MANGMVRASGGFSEENMREEFERGKAAAKVGSAGIADVLAGKTFTNSDAIGATGNMPNKGSSNIVMSGSQRQEGIPKGYYDGSGIVDATAVYTAGYNSGHADWQNTAGATAEEVWASGERVTSLSKSYTASKAGILIIYVSVARFSSSSTEPTLSGMQIHGARRALAGTLYRNEDKPTSAPERAYANSGMWIVEVAAGATVTWSVLIANNAYAIWNHTLIAM